MVIYEGAHVIKNNRYKMYNKKVIILQVNKLLADITLLIAVLKKFDCYVICMYVNGYCIRDLYA